MRRPWQGGARQPGGGGSVGEPAVWSEASAVFEAEGAAADVEGVVVLFAEQDGVVEAGGAATGVGGGVVRDESAAWSAGAAGDLAVAAGLEAFGAAFGGGEGAAGVADLEDLVAEAEHEAGDGAVAQPPPDQAARQAGAGGGDGGQAAGGGVQAVEADGDGEVRGGLVAQAGDAAVEVAAQAVAQRVVALLVQRPRSGAASSSGPVVAVAVLAVVQAGGVEGVVGVDGAFGVEDGLEQFAALEVELAAGDEPAAAVVLAPQPQAAVLVGAFGAVFELLREQRVEQQGEGAGQLRRFEVGGEQEQGVGEPVELTGRAGGDASRAG